MYFTQKYLSIIPLDIKEVSIFGSIKSKYLKSTGIDKNIIKKHNLDLLLASTAISENATLKYYFRDTETVIYCGKKYKVKTLPPDGVKNISKSSKV